MAPAKSLGAVTAGNSTDEGKIKDEMSIWILLKLKLSTLCALFMCHIVTSSLYSPLSCNTALNLPSFEILFSRTLTYPQARK